MPRKRARRTKEPARRSLPAALTDPRCYGRGVTKVRTVETHVSWVFLTGRYAYKIKKPVKLPFVDFSTLALRRRFCREELRVNRRLAPALYLAVVPIGGSPAAPRIGRKPAIEYAVKMREFPTAARLDRRLAAKRVPRAALAEFGARLARFHAGLRPVRGIAADEIGATALRNIDELAEYLGPWQPEQARNAASLDAAARRAPRGAVCVARGSRRAPRVPRRFASAESALARRRNHGVRRTGVRPQAARYRRHQRGRVPRHGFARARARRSRLRVHEPLPRGQRRLPRRRRAALLPRPARVGPRQGRRHQARAGRRRTNAATTTTSQRR